MISNPKLQKSQNKDTRIFKAPYKKRWESAKQYDHFKTLGAVPLPPFPITLLAPYYIDVQTKQNCTAYSGVKERFGVTGKRYDPEAYWTDELQYLGIADAPNGVDLDTKMQVGIKVGFYVQGTVGHEDAAKAYFWVKKVGGYDWFDSVRLAIYQLYQKYGKVIPVTIGVNWYQEWDNTPNGILTDNAKTLLGGHDIEIAGLQTYSIDGIDYLFLPGTWGTEYGDEGCFRVNRAIFNKYFDGFGAAYWSDDETLVPAKMNLIIALCKNAILLLKRLIAKKNGFPPPTPAPFVYFWDNPGAVRLSVRELCDEMGLPYDQKNILCACVEVESNFNTRAVHYNKDKNGETWSADWGVVQINDYFHIGEGKDFPSVDYVLNNPEACVRWMIKMFLAGKQGMWSSYSQRLYKKYL